MEEQASANTLNTSVDSDFLGQSTVSVISKTSCFFEIEISEQESTKPGRRGQRQVLATKTLREEVGCLIINGHVPIATGKVDGTCTYFYKGDNGQVTVGMRQDLRIPKEGKHAVNYVSKKGRPSEPPAGWFSLVDKPDHTTVGGKWAHHIGFRPADPTRDKWAFDAIEDEKVRVLVSISPIKFQMVPIEQLEGKTCELMGPKIASDPHGFGKHCFAVHGSFPIVIEEDITDVNVIKKYLVEDPIGQLFEGVVWHFPKANKCFKVHRGHLGMEWKD